MDIVFNIDNGYARHMCVTMLSILDTNKSVDFCFHVMTFDLSKENRLYIVNLANKYNASVKFYDVDVNLLKDFPIGASTGNPKLSYATYLRLFIADMLPESVEKVLFLDCDIVVINSLIPIWNTDITNYCLAAVTDYGMAEELGAKRMKIGDSYRYFNAGVLLINLTRLREMDFLHSVISFVKDNKDIIKLHDQDILNGMFYDRRLVLSDRWNMMCNTDNTKDYTIIHFAGMKPWYIECPHPLKDVYYKYLNQTQWAGTPPIHLYSYWDRAKKLVKRIIGKE